jgi:rhomboid protease GluP
LANPNLTKLRIIYVPFLLIAVGCVVGFSLFNRLILIGGGPMRIEERAVNVWISSLLSWIPIFIWLRPRMRGLNLAGDQYRLLNAFYFTAAIAVPTVIAQLYLATEAGKLTRFARFTRPGSRVRVL